MCVAIHDSLVADKINRAAHVDVHKVNIQVLIQQLGAAAHGVWKTSADLRQQSNRSQPTISRS